MTWKILASLDTRIGRVSVIRHDHDRPLSPAYMLSHCGEPMHIGRAAGDETFSEMTASEWGWVWDVIHTDHSRREPTLATVAV